MTGKKNQEKTSIGSQEQGMSKVPFFTRGFTRQMMCNNFELQFTLELNRLRENLFQNDMICSKNTT